jgi:hypothetical protein
MKMKIEKSENEKLAKSKTRKGGLGKNGAMKRIYSR